MPIRTDLILPLKADCPEKLLGWVNYRNSLTEKLKKLTGEAQLLLLKQQWLPTDLWSLQLLELQDSSVFQREIIMKSHQKPYWYARSLIPQACYDISPTFFDRLNNESIKNLIFKTKEVSLIKAINYPIDAHCLEYYWVKKYIDTLGAILWVRIAEFTFDKKSSFYLIEIMLPELESLS